MDREIFKEKLKEDISKYTDEERSYIIRESLKPLDTNKDGTQNLVIIAEEFMEAGIEITKYLRGKGDFTGLVEELADAYLSIKYAQEICEISDEILQKAIDIKLERQKERNVNK